MSIGSATRPPLPAATRAAAPQPVRPGYVELKANVHKKLLNRLNLEALATADRARAEGEIKALVNELLAEENMPISMGERDVLYGHVFRNAMLLIIAGFPGAFIGAFFAGALLIETIFSLDGLGLLSFESIEKRDYPVIFATLWIFSLMGLLLNILSDFAYTLVDPRIDFESREV